MGRRVRRGSRHRPRSVPCRRYAGGSAEQAARQRHPHPGRARRRTRRRLPRQARTRIVRATACPGRTAGCAGCVTVRARRPRRRDRRALLPRWAAPDATRQPRRRVVRHGRGSVRRGQHGLGVPVRLRHHRSRRGIRAGLHAHLGSHTGRGEGRVRAVRGRHGGAHRPLAGHAHLPLRELRTRRTQPPRRAVRNPRGRDRPVAAERSPGRPDEGVQGQLPRVSALLLDQEAGAALRPDPHRGRHHRR